MKTIKSILDNASELIQDNLTERFGEKCLERQINPPLDQALKEISELIDEAKPEWIFDDGHNDATWAYKKSADKFQSNLKELLK